MYSVNQDNHAEGSAKAYALRGTVSFFNNADSSRVGAVALYTALWAVVAKYRKWPFSAPC
jgi:hypothetical protein